MMRLGLGTSSSVAGYDVLSKRPLLGARQLLLAALAGLASALISQFAGRALHAVWPIPGSGSLVTALPRAIILLMLLRRVERFGILTSAGVAEVAAKLALGGVGPVPWALAVPVLGNLAGDLAWAALGLLRSQRLRMTLTGACLCTGRVLAALLFWSVFLSAAQGRLGGVHGLIVAANAVSGAIAGVMISRQAGRKQGGGNDDA